jgi:cysteine desulfurase
MSDEPALVYLDHAATTPMRAEAVQAMLAFLDRDFANPSSSYRFAHRARRAVDDARDAVAAVLGAAPGEVVFTGGGTEADGTAVLGVVRHHGGVAVCPEAEHHAVLHPVEHVGGRVVGVDPTGAVDLSALSDALDERVRVVSVMTVNNEVGTVSPLPDVAALVRERAPGALVHTDAVQAASWLDLREVWRHVDLLSLSAHKFGGPKGVGVLVVRDGVALEPLLLGGGQERGRRSGTLNVGGIVAMAVALQAADAERDSQGARLTALRDRLVDALQGELDGVVETVPRAAKVAGSAHVCIEGIESEELLFLLDEAGVCASAGSACAAGATDPSHVLAAMGVPSHLTRGALRLSLGRTTTATDVDRAVTAIVGAVHRLRAAR